MPSVTLPCHTSMLRGVPPERHGITDNDFHPLARPVPSLIDRAAAAGKSTAFFYNWEQLRDLAAPGSLTVSYMHQDCYSESGDRQIAETAVSHLERQAFDFTFLYLGWPDECAHRNGWMSPPYLKSIENADRCIGRVLAGHPAADDLTVLVISDHGGHERTHGTDMDEDMLIPWILAGPDITAGEITEPVSLMDVPATLAHALGILPAPQWEGRVVN
jgi:predicted AlkP superfamily pyrophosphatase or phosphodiesterase